jgi:hypothetical protein
MIGLAVYLNRKRLAIAGAEDLCVLSAGITAVGDLGAATASVRPRRGVDLHLSVGGLTRRAEKMPDEHLRWVRLRRLKVGDRISVKIVRTAKPDKYVSATPAVRDSKKQVKARKMRLKLAIKRFSKTKGAIRGIKR